MKSSFLKDLLAVFTSRVAVVVFGLISSVVTARYLGPEGNGVIAALMVYPSLFMSIGALGIRQSTTYFVGQNTYDVDDVYGAVLAIWIFTSLICLASCFTLIQYFTSGEYSLLMIVLAIAPIPFSLYNTYSSGVFLGKQNIKQFNRINWIPAVVNCVITFILIGVFSFGVLGSMAGTFAGVFILFFFVVAKMSRIVRIKPVFNLKMIKKMLGLGLIYAVSLLVINLNYKVDIIILEKMSTAYELGIYSKGVGIVNYLWEVPMLLSTLVFSRSAGAKDPKEFSIKVCRLLRFAGTAVLGSCVLLYLLSPYIIDIMYGADFTDSTLVLKLLMPGVFLLTIYKVLNMDLAGKGRPWVSMIAMVPAVIINVILNCLWVPSYGASGSAFASTVSYSIAALIYLFVYSREVGIPVKQILKFTKDDLVFASSALNGLKARLLINNRRNDN